MRELNIQNLEKKTIFFLFNSRDISVNYILDINIIIINYIKTQNDTNEIIY